MKKELEHFYIGASYGGNQEWFNTFMMKIGGCAAETAIEVCIYFDKHFGTRLCPFDVENLSREEYIAFGDIMKPYLHPRMTGINKTSIYVDGFSQYLKEKGSSISLESIEGYEDCIKAKKALICRIDREIPVPFLCLYHKSRRLKDYEWHWFIINGYELFGDTLMVKAVTYSSWKWLDFDELWNSGTTPKGGMIIINK